MWDKLSKIASISPDKLSKIFELIKQVGIYESFKAMMKNPLFKNAVKQKLSELYNSLVSKYDIEAHSVEIHETDGGCSIVVTVTIPDPDLRKEFLDNLHNAVKNLFSSNISLIPPFIKEFEIKNISAKERGEVVVISFTGNENLYGLLKEIGGDFVEESKEG